MASHKHLELDEFTKLMNTSSYKLSDIQYLQMLECAVSSSVVLIKDLLRHFPKQAKKRMQLNKRDLALMNKFCTRVHKSLKNER